MIPRRTSVVSSAGSDGPVPLGNPFHTLAAQDQSETYTPAVGRAQFGGIEQIENIATEWQELCSHAREDEPFYRPEWIRAYLRAFHERHIVILTAWRGGTLQAVLPLVQLRTWFCGVPVRMLRGAANSHSGRFDLVLRAGLQDSAIAAIWQQLRGIAAWDVIEIPFAPEGGAAEALAAAAQRHGFLTGTWESSQMPYMRISADCDDSQPWSRAPDAHFRQNLRRRWRKLHAQGALELVRVEAADPAALRKFFDLEYASWKGRNGTAIACAGNTIQFYTDIAREAEHHRSLSLYFLELNGATIAAQFGLTYNHRYYPLKTAFDEAYSAYAPGHLIVGAILRDCGVNRIAELDFLGDCIEWKLAWTRSLRPHNKYYIFRNDVRGRYLNFAKLRILSLAKSAANKMGIR